MHLTIERLRTMVLLAAVLLVVALGIFLAIGRWRSPFNRRDLPKRLGIDIQQEANGFTHAEFRSGRAMFKITASKVEQLKDDRFRLHTVKIEMYGIDNTGTDRIEGNEFEYDQKTGIAEAAGPVEITLIRPGKDTNQHSGTLPGQANGDKPKNSGDGLRPNSSEIRVKTSGLSFDQNSGVASTSQRVDFDVAQGSGSAVGASYDSQNGRLVLNREVVLNTMRGADPVVLHAQHGEFEQGDQLCRLNSAVATYRDGEARAEFATIQFREDGSAEQLDASKGLVLTTATRGTLAAPTGTLLFDEQSNPRHGHLEGGVVIDSNENGRRFHGTSPTAELEFTSAGMLNHAHLERGVKFSSEEQAVASGVSTQTARSWVSPIADLEFSNSGKGQMALSKIHGNGGVEITGESRRGSDAVMPSQMAADDVTGVFGTNSALTTVIGVGHASLAETTATGTRQSTSGDRLEAHFVSGPPTDAKPNRSRNNSSGLARSTRIESATVVGNVVLVQQPAATKNVPAQPIRATAARAVYEGAGQWLHLTGSPYVENVGLQLVANKIDFSQASGDAFAHGDVKATWLGNEDGATQKGTLSDTSRQMPALGAQGPAHIVSAEAHLQQSNGDATFTGQARLWQQGNSVAAPLIILDRTKQTLIARTTDPADPVRVVLVTSAGPGANKNDKSESPSVIRVRGADLKYSDAERKAVMRARPEASVVAETSTATTRSNEVELILLPPGNHAASNGAAAKVDRMTARGQVTIDSMGRKGTGDQLVYSGERGEYTLTGTVASPPRLTDLIRGTVTGHALIFNSRDDSVNVEGDGRETMTETTVPKQP